VSDVPVAHLPSAVQHPVRQVDALQAAPSVAGPSNEASYWPSSPVRPQPSARVSRAARVTRMDRNLIGQAR
jgi:hypothetical protein